MQSRLEGYINVELFNNTQMVLDFKNRPFFPPQKTTSNYYTFYSKGSLLNWVYLSSSIREEFKIHSEVFHDDIRTKPYFFKRLDNIYIVQNTNTGKKDDALALVTHWDEYRVNKGAAFTHEIELNKGLKDVVSNILHPNGSGPKQVNILEYDFSEEIGLLLRSANTGDYHIQHKLLDAVVSQSQKYINFHDHMKVWWAQFLSLLINHYGQYINVKTNSDIKTSDMGAKLLEELKEKPFKLYAALLLV